MKLVWKDFRQEEFRGLISRDPKRSQFKLRSHRLFYNNQIHDTQHVPVDHNFTFR